MATFFALIGVIAGSLGQLWRNLVLKQTPKRVVARSTVSRSPLAGPKLTMPSPLWPWIAALLALVLLAFILISTRSGPKPQLPSFAVSPPPANQFHSADESWSYLTGLPWRPNTAVWSTPAIGADGTVYALGDNSLLAFEPGGKLKWSYARRFAGDPQVALLIADDGAIWTGTRFGWLIRITPEGVAQEQFGGMGSTNQLALSSEGYVLLSGDLMSGYILTSGYPKEQRDISDAIRGNPGPMKSAAFTQAAVISIDKNRLSSSSLDFQRRNWMAGELPTCHHPAIARDGTIYLSCSNGVAALSPDGSEIWKIPVQGPTPAVIAENGNVVFGALDGNVYCLAPDGRLKWTFDTTSPIASVPAISRSGTIYVGGRAGGLYAIDPSGNVLWTVRMKGEVFSPAIASDGTVYVQSSDGVLHAIARPENGGLAGQWPKLDADERNTDRSPF